MAAPQNQPLPPNPYSAVTHLEWHNAYACCLDLQHGTKPQIIQARVLGYLIIEAPIQEGRTYVCKEILQCGGDSNSLRQLADSYVSHLIRLFKQSKGVTPAPSEHPSRPSFKKDMYWYRCTLNEAPTNHLTAKKLTLARDSFRCLGSGKMEYAHFRTLTPAEQALVSSFSVTNAAHIFPPSTNRSLNPDLNDDPKTQYSGTVWAMVHNFSGISVLDKLNGPSIHRLSNILTLDPTVHQLFDNLELWFEPVPNAMNTYDIRSPTPLVPYIIPHTRVTFSTNTDLSLPDPRYLELHAAICRIAHLSGAAEYVESYERDIESTRVLAHDGSSADTLAFALQRVQVF